MILTGISSLMCWRNCFSKLLENGAKNPGQLTFTANVLGTGTMVAVLRQVVTVCCESDIFNISVTASASWLAHLFSTLVLYQALQPFLMLSLKRIFFLTSAVKIDIGWSSGEGADFSTYSCWKDQSKYALCLAHPVSWPDTWGLSCLCSLWYFLELPASFPCSLVSANVSSLPPWHQLSVLPWLCFSFLVTWPSHLNFFLVEKWFYGMTLNICIPWRCMWGLSNIIAEGKKSHWWPCLVCTGCSQGETQPSAFNMRIVSIIWKTFCLELDHGEATTDTRKNRTANLWYQGKLSEKRKIHITNSRPIFSYSWNHLIHSIPTHLSLAPQFPEYCIFWWLCSPIILVSATFLE